MARARNLKPAFFMNEELAACGFESMILFAGLWCHADREGRLEDRPARIKAHIFPYHDLSVDHYLDVLTKRRFIIRYSMNGNKYIQIINFTKHQNPHVKEQASTIPAPDLSGASTGDSGTSPALTLNPLPLTLNPITTLSGKTPDAKKTKSQEYPEEFEQTWALYPKREGDNPKKGAFSCWNARRKEGFTIEVMRQGVERYVLYCKAKDQVGTSFVMQTKRFFGVDKPFQNSWQVGHGGNGTNQKPGKIQRAADAIRKSHGTSNPATANGSGTGIIEDVGTPARLRADRR